MVDDFIFIFSFLIVDVDETKYSALNQPSSHFTSLLSPHHHQPLSQSSSHHQPSYLPSTIKSLIISFSSHLSSLFSLKRHPEFVVDIVSDIRKLNDISVNAKTSGFTSI